MPTSTILDNLHVRHEHDEAERRSGVHLPRSVSEALRGRSSWVVLFAVLFGLSLVVDPLSSLGSDVGGKTATMTVLSSNGSLDLGYWAEAFDPDGSLYPFYATSVLGGKWVNATTFPMLYLAWPLHELGGMHLAMILPVLGGVFTATAARRLAAMLGPTDGTVAFWIVGLGTPVTVYSLAFWEHAPGLALMSWGLVAVVTAVDNHRMAPALAAGALFGLAATMRQEALVYGALGGLGLAIGLATTARPLVVLRSSIVMGTGGLAMLTANTVLERMVLGSVLRSGRAGGTASLAGTKLDDRLHDALVTLLVPSAGRPAGIAMGTLLLLGTVVLVRSGLTMGEQRPAVAMVALPMLMVVVTAVVNGRSFVPSLLFSTPLVVVGAIVGWGDARTRALTIYAVVAIPSILAVQSTGGFEAQWGGRYLLLSGWVLTVVACARCQQVERSSWAFMAAMSLGITALGVVWTVERSHAMGDFYAAIASFDAPVVVFDSSLTARGAGSIALDQPMLAAADPSARAEASDLFAEAGVAAFLFVAPDLGDAPPTFDGFTEVGTTTVAFVSGLDYRVWTFAAEG